MLDLISRQAAIEHLKKRLYETELNNNAKYPYYAEMADNRVSVWLEELPKVWCEYWDGESCFCALHRPADPVKKGKWKRDADGLVWCYECGFGKERSDERPYRYCPNCGAKMERSEE